MARKAFSTVINGYTYDTVQLGWEAGVEVSTRIARVLGAAANANDPIGSVLRALSAEDVVYLCKTFGKITTVTGEEYADRKPCVKDVLEEHFAGDLGSCARWLAWCLEVNFSDFFQRAGLSALAKKAKAQGTLPSLKDVIGQSSG